MFTSLLDTASAVIWNPQKWFFLLDFNTYWALCVRHYPGLYVNKWGRAWFLLSRNLGSSLAKQRLKYSMLPLTGSSKIGAKNNLTSSKNPISLFVGVEVVKCSTLRKVQTTWHCWRFMLSPLFSRIGPKGSQKEFKGRIQYFLFYIVHPTLYFLPSGFSDADQLVLMVGGKRELKANNTSGVKWRWWGFSDIQGTFCRINSFINHFWNEQPI